ncbi:MAG: phosphoglycerate dehydrogenase [Hyphomicrobiales bacterium]|nr:MAG: phosphoglycerate dehydrogenase [Hyphomicrobiales bacterium]
MKPRVLISDKLSPAAVEIFKNNNIDVDVKTGLTRDELIEIIGDYDGLAIRSATKPTEKVIAAASKLKVIGRAGIGVDNVDIPAATAKGIIVMNTPFGNSITTAEHAITMMLSLARQIPEANASTHAGKWEKSRFMGVEVTAKTLGIIGCGNIGSITASRAIGLKMKVIAFDPFLTQERAQEIGVEKVELDELLARSDFISLHTPMTDKTRNIINADAMAKMKKGAMIINCARGGLVVEADLKAALESGHIGGAALDVFEVEPAKDNALFGMENVICTPHLGASTQEAQENVAVQVAEQMSDFLINGAITNAINFPSISAEEAPSLQPFITLAEQLGSFAGQLTESSVNGVRIEYVGDVSAMNTNAFTSSALTGLLKPVLEDVNMVSAPAIARERGIQVEEIKREHHSVFDSYMRLTVMTERQERSVAGTVFSDGNPRIIQIKGIDMEAELGPNMLYTTNTDTPGYIGALGMILGEEGVNIATFNLGRSAQGADAIALLEIDEPVRDETLARVRALPQVTQAKRLKF